MDDHVEIAKAFRAAVNMTPAALERIEAARASASASRVAGKEAVARRRTAERAIRQAKQKAVAP